RLTGYLLTFCGILAIPSGLYQTKTERHLGMKNPITAHKQTSRRWRTYTELADILLPGLCVLPDLHIHHLNRIHKYKKPPTGLPTESRSLAEDCRHACGFSAARF